MSNKPSIPQGTRDFPASVVRRRQYILNVLRSIFEQYGFQPLETPAMENLSTLTGKYGEEGDRLIFKILNNGLHEKKDKALLGAAFGKLLERPGFSTDITERALRYDLTIPFARFVATNYQELAMPFRRYQMQPVWRADRPQRGRYREFWQCDCDVVGTESLLCEAELLAMYRQAFHALNIPGITVKINSRKILEGLAEICGLSDSLPTITVALDKLDKILWSGVAAELTSKGIPESAVGRIEAFTRLQGSNQEILSGLETLMADSLAGKEGITELYNTLEKHDALALTEWTSGLKVDVSLARGLNYYTGIIMEVTTGAVVIGSLGGGGRYDNLTALFGVKGLSGVGVSFGIDRMYDVLEELNLFPESVVAENGVMLVNFGGDEALYSMELLRNLRAAGVSAEMYPDVVKLDKQLKYAAKRGLTHVIIAGEKETSQRLLSLKNFKSGQQETLSLEEAIAALKQLT